MKKILFIDRDGTIIQEPQVDYQVDSMEKLAFVPGVIGALREIVRETDYRLVMVSNQDGLGTERFPMDAFLPPHEFMLKTLAGEGIVFDEILIDGSMPGDGSPRRKPGIGMVEKYLNEWLDRENSYVIGDRLTDGVFTYCFNHGFLEKSRAFSETGKSTGGASEENGGNGGSDCVRFEWNGAGRGEDGNCFF